MTEKMSNTAPPISEQAEVENDYLLDGMEDVIAKQASRVIKHMWIILVGLPLAIGLVLMIVKWG